LTLTTEDLGDIFNVDSPTLDEVLRQDGFGKFAILAAREVEYIQAGNDWQPGEDCCAFLQRHDSDPWLLEYREGESQFRATGHVTLDQVRRAFLSYLAGRSEWRSWFSWCEMEI
jgi:hypothetical protein